MSKLVSILFALLFASPAGAVNDSLVDPTRPAGFSIVVPAAGPDQSRVAAPKLQAVFSIGSQYSALIDGRRVHVGDQLAGYRVQAIGRGGVRLQGDGEPLVLRLADSGIKKASGENKR